MPHKFKTGDAVVLKKGSALMTVKGCAIKQTVQGICLADDKYICTWLIGAKYKKAVFHEDDLQRVEIISAGLR